MAFDGFGMIGCVDGGELMVMVLIMRCFVAMMAATRSGMRIVSLFLQQLQILEKGLLGGTPTDLSKWNLKFSNFRLVEKRTPVICLIYPGEPLMETILDLIPKGMSKVKTRKWYQISLSGNCGWNRHLDAWMVALGISSYRKHHQDSGCDLELDE